MKKIMFNDKYRLTEATLIGNKTNTRRTSQKLQCLSDLSDSGYTPQIRGNKVIAVKGNESVVVCTIPYQVGEVVAVAQSYKDCGEFDVYEAPKGTAGWNNKMFVKADPMPYRIKITGLRIERLQEISNDDCLREGIHKHISHAKCYYTHSGIGNYFFEYPRDAFHSLINLVSGKGTWERNPFVFVYDFNLIK